MGTGDNDLPETVSVSGSAEVGRTPASPPAPARSRAPLEIREGDCLGRYTVRALIGAGGMGRVFAAFDPELGRTVALKLIRPDRLTPSPRARARLMREAQALARLAHPNVVAVYDVGTQDDEVFVAMELVSGPTLTEWRRAGERGWREVLATFLAAGRGLAAAHGAGIVHRDFKPENVIVGKERVVVVDFGLARAGAEETPPPETLEAERLLEVSLTLTGERVGTVAYMAPEQLAGEVVTPKTDQFSFCLCLWEALHGDRPSSGESAGKPRRPQVPAWVNAAVTRGLARDPKARWPSMVALLDALARDPAATRRRILAAAAAMTLGIGAVWGLLRSPRVDPCAGAVARLGGVWDAPRQQKVGAAFAATKLAYSDDAWRRVSTRIDDYVARWADMHAETCRATRVEGRQSDTLMDLRMACLEGRRTVLAALTELWAGGMDAESLQAATGAARGLPPLAECADARSLGERAPLPADPSLAARIAAIRVRLDAVQALNLAHRWAEARKAAAAVRAEADAAGWPQLRAEAAFAEGVSLYELRDPTARSPLLQAAQLAAEARDDRLAARAIIQLVEDLSLHQETQGRALLVADVADVLVARAGNDAALRGQLLHNRGETLLAEQKYDAAAGMLLAAGVYFTTAFGAADAETLANTGQLVRVFIGQGNLAAARKLGEENLAATIAALGEEHPYVGVILNNLASPFLHSGDLATAAGYYRRALAIDERVAGPDAQRTTMELGNLGEVYLELGNLDEALALLERASSIDERVLGPQASHTVLMRVYLAAVRRKRGDYQQALELLEPTLALAIERSGASHRKVGDLLVAIGEVKYVQGDSAGALDHYRRGLEICTKARGAENPATLQATMLVARTLARLRRCSEARPLAATAVAGFEKTPDDNAPELARALAIGGECDLADGHAAKAAVVLERATAIVDRAQVSPLDRGVVRWPLARALWSLGRRDAAVAAAQTAERELAGDADGASDRAAARAWLAARG